MSAVEAHSRREALQRRLVDLKARMPAHSIPPSMMMELDELEEQLAALDAAGETEKATQAQRKEEQSL